MIIKFEVWKQGASKSIKDVLNKIKKYFAIYGGFSAMLTSFYFIIAFIINIVMFKSWISLCWIENVKSIIPSIVGFSLSAYAILVGFGTDNFQKFISSKIKISKEEQKQKKLQAIANTMYQHINTTFVHYIMIQMLSLLLALICDSLFSTDMNLSKIVISFIGNLMFLYSLTLNIAAVFVIFDVAYLYQEFNNSSLADKK